VSLPSWSFSTSRQQHLPFPITPQGGLQSSITPSTHVSSYFWIIHRAPRLVAWFIARPTFQAFWLSSPYFSTMFQTRFRLPHLSIVGILQCVCTHPINVTGVHFLCCTHGNEHMGTHVTVRDTFAIISWDVNFHVGQK